MMYNVFSLSGVAKLAQGPYLIFPHSIWSLSPNQESLSFFCPTPINEPVATLWQSSSFVTGLSQWASWHSLWGWNGDQRMCLTCEWHFRSQQTSISLVCFVLSALQAAKWLQELPWKHQSKIQANEPSSPRYPPRHLAESKDLGGGGGVAGFQDVKPTKNKSQQSQPQ